MHARLADLPARRPGNPEFSGRCPARPCSGHGCVSFQRPVSFIYSGQLVPACLPRFTVECVLVKWSSSWSCKSTASTICFRKGLHTAHCRLQPSHRGVNRCPHDAVPLHPGRRRCDCLVLGTKRAKLCGLASSSLPRAD